MFFPLLQMEGGLVEWVSGWKRGGKEGGVRRGIGGWKAFPLKDHCLADHPHLNLVCLSAEFRTHYPKRQHLGVLNILSGRSLRKQKQGNTLDLRSLPRPSSPSYSEDPHVPPRDRCPPYTRREGASLSPKTKGAKKNPNKEALLSFPHLQHLP